MVDDISALEYSILRVPYENLNREFRNAQKNIDRTAKSVREAIEAANSHLWTNQSIDAGEVDAPVKNVIEKVAAFSKVVDENLDEEIALIDVLLGRIARLDEEDGIPDDDDEKLLLETRKLDRMVAEQLLRFGHTQAAKELIEKAGLEGMLDVDVYEKANQVVQGIRNHDTAPLLEWCHEHRSKLRRADSQLEVAVHAQEAIELVREGKPLEAVLHMRKHVGHAAESQWPDEVVKVMGLIACGPRTNIVGFREMLNKERWERLEELFRDEHRNVYSLPEYSPFSVALQSGLCAYKTPSCSPKSNKNCPCCDETTFALGEGLPFAHAANSRLICGYSGDSLDDENSPMLLPTGHVYGEKAVVSLTEGDVVLCPKTNTYVPLAEIMRLFVL